jgi:hypothetical protein
MIFRVHHAYIHICISVSGALASSRAVISCFSAPRGSEARKDYNHHEFVPQNRHIIQTCDEDASQVDLVDLMPDGNSKTTLRGIITGLVHHQVEEMKLMNLGSKYKWCGGWCNQTAHSCLGVMAPHMRPASVPDSSIGTVVGPQGHPSCLVNLKTRGVNLGTVPLVYGPLVR